MDNNKPITMITVLCDPKKVQRIALTCKCSTRWTELVPGELHDSQIIAQFSCPKCGQLYWLRDHTLQRVEEDAYDRQSKRPIAAIKSTNRFDA